MLTDSGRVPLGQRIWIGDGRTGASLAPDGTIDWFCPDGLGSAPALWRLLDRSGAAVRVGPIRDGSDARRVLPTSTSAYRAGTNVADTAIAGPAGRRLSITDFMAWPNGSGVVRIARALSGPVDVEVEVVTPRARHVATPAGALVVDGLEVRAPGAFEAAPIGRSEARWRSVFRLDTGQEAVVTLAEPQPLSPDGAHRLLDATETAWRSWLARLVYEGAHRTALERALLAVRALTGPSGAPAAAGTTSLPRRVGSERTADDRWVRLRQAATAVGILAQCGLAEDAEGVETWLRHSLSTAHLPWPAWLDADGQPVPEAEELPFEGWQRSQPVRAGRDQPPADAGHLGAVVAALGASTTGPGGRPDDPGPLSAAWPALAQATDWVTDHWREPDSGRWEIERPLRVYTAGRVGVWTALDRMVRLARAANPLDLQAVAWQQEARLILSAMETESVAPDGGLAMEPRSDEADAALLAVAWQGPWPRKHPIVASTVERVLDRLGSGAFLFRYSDRVADERSGPDNPDLEATLWAVKALARLDRWDEAHERMEAVVGLIDPSVGETVDPLSGQVLGNFPCTATALALVDAAKSLEAGPR